jgi:hypothetical protein
MMSFFGISQGFLKRLNYFCRYFDHRLAICAALLSGSMSNNQRQGFRLVRANALRAVWRVFFVFLTFEYWVLTIGHLQVVCVWGSASSAYEREGPAPPYILGGLGYNV